VYLDPVEISVGRRPRKFSTFFELLSFLSLLAFLPCFPWFQKNNHFFSVFKKKQGFWFLKKSGTYDIKPPTTHCPSKMPHTIKCGGKLSGENDKIILNVFFFGKSGKLQTFLFEFGCIFTQFLSP